MPHVLVVDDSAMDRRLVGGLLERQPDFAVSYAADGAAALAEINRHLPDVVVTDMNMPVMDGLELVSKLKEQRPGLPVILITSRGSEETAVQALQRGAASYVPKRSVQTSLAETIQHVLSSLAEDQLRGRLMQSMQEQSAELSLENDPELVSSAVKFLLSNMTSMGVCSESDRVRLGVALQEALANACFHGNLEVSSALREQDHHSYYDLAKQRATELPYRDRRIHVSVKCTQQEATFVIRDEGPGFDPSSLPDPTDPENLERPCGRGLLLMRTFMDDVRYNPTGNQVTLVKRRKSDGDLSR